MCALGCIRLSMASRPLPPTISPLIGLSFIDPIRDITSTEKTIYTLYIQSVILQELKRLSQKPEAFK